MDWGDLLTTSASASTSGYIALAPSGTFSTGQSYTFLQATGGGLNAATGYLLGNVTNYSASLSITSTSVSITPTASVPPSARPTGTAARSPARWRPWPSPQPTSATG